MTSGKMAAVCRVAGAAITAIAVEGYEEAGVVGSDRPGLYVQNKRVTFHQVAGPTRVVYHIGAGPRIEVSSGVTTNVGHSMVFVAEYGSKTKYRGTRAMRSAISKVS